MYSAYLSAWSVAYLLPVAVVGFALGERGLQVLQNFVLSNWSNATAAASAEHKTAHNRCGWGRPRGRAFLCEERARWWDMRCDARRCMCGCRVGLMRAEPTLREKNITPTLPHWQCLPRVK